MGSIVHELVHGFHFQVPFSESDVPNFAKHERCPTCRQAGGAERLAELGHDDWSARVQLVECNSCGVIYYENPPTYDFIKNYYENTWNKNSGEDQKVSTAVRKRVKTVTPKMLEELGYTNKDAAILELGCGLGDMLAGFVEAGFPNVWGAEMSQHRVDVCERRFPGRVFAGGYDGVPDEMRFDVIYMRQVLEHVFDPGDAFDWMKKHLNPGGVILISVPDSTYEPIVMQVLWLPHLHSFTVKSLQALGEQRGLKSMFWTKHRFWDLNVAYFDDQTEISPKPGSYIDGADYPSHLKETQKARIAGPWCGGSGELRYLTTRMTVMSSDRTEQVAGFAEFNIFQRVVGRVRIALSRALKAMGYGDASVWISKPSSYITISPQKDASRPPVVGTPDGKAMFLMK